MNKSTTIYVLFPLLICAGAKAQTEWSLQPCRDGKLGFQDVETCKYRRFKPTFTAPKPPLVDVYKIEAETDNFVINISLWHPLNFSYVIVGHIFTEENARKTIRSVSRSASPRNWGPYSSFGNTGFMQFVSKSNWSCFGFQHSAFSVGGVIEGYFCQPAPMPDVEERVKEVLTAIRYESRSALGGSITPLRFDPLAFGDQGVKSSVSSSNVAAIHEEGWRLINGVGVPKDPARGVALIRQAADKDHPKSQGFLAWFYLDGLHGLPKSDSDAFKYGFLAFYNGYVSAGNELGVLYRDGRGVARDVAVAAQYFEDCANGGGTSWCARNLGLLYRDGNGIPKDEKKSREWLQKAAASGNKAAQQDLSRPRGQSD